MFLVVYVRYGCFNCIIIFVYVVLENELRINFLIDNIYDCFDLFILWIESLN